MKRQTILGAAVIGFAGSLLASPADTADMPFQYPDRCTEKPSIVLPSNQEGTAYYFNRDCTVAFVVPPPTGEVTVSNPVKFSALRSCPLVNVTATQITDLQKSNLLLAKRLKDSSLSDAERNSILDQMEKTRVLSDKLQAAYDKVPALTVQLNFKNSLTPEYMNAITLANMPNIERGVLKIRPAPLSKSYITFNAQHANAETFASNPVLESNIMGLLSAPDQNPNSRESVIFDGAAQGYVTLSLSGACDLLTGDFSKPKDLNFDKEAANNLISVTRTMAVPLITSFGYKAEYNVENATKTLFNKSGLKSQFTSTEFINLMLDGDSAEAFKVTSWTFEDGNGAIQTQMAENMKPENIRLIQLAMVERYAAQLVQFNVIREIKPLETPDSGNEVNTGVRQECWSSSSFFGLSRSGGCRDVTYQFLVPRDGTSQQQADITNNLGLKVSQTVEMLQPISTPHTAIFKFKAGAQ